VKYSPSTKGFYITEIHVDNIPSDCIEITQEEYALIYEAQCNNTQIILKSDKNSILIEPSSNITWEEIRSIRKVLLTETDWIDLPNTPVKNKQAWLNYRTTLRNIPQSYHTPSEVVWPKKPC